MLLLCSFVGDRLSNFLRGRRKQHHYFAWLKRSPLQEMATMAGGARMRTDCVRIPGAQITFISWDIFSKIHLDIECLTQFYFIGNNFTTSVSYPRLWMTPHLSPVLRVKHWATSPPHKEQGTQAQIIHQYISCRGWVSVSLWVRHQHWRYLVHICKLLWSKKIYLSANRQLFLFRFIISLL